MAYSTLEDKDKQTETVGIASLGHYIPSGVITSSEMSRRSGIPLHVFIEKIGMEQKHIAADDEHPSEMGIKAAQIAMNKAGIGPEDIDIIAYCGAGFYDYRIWSPSARIQAALGASNSYAFELKNGCNGGNLGLNICRNLLLGDPDKKYALVVCSEKLSINVDYADKNALSLFMLGDGASAAVLKKGEIKNRLLDYSSITDGSIVDYIKMPVGGTKMPHVPGHNVAPIYIRVDDPEGLDRILFQNYLHNYVSVISKAVERSGHSLEDIDMLFTNQVKKSLLNDILQSMNLTEDRTMVSIKEYGHIGSVDSFFNLSRAIDQGKLGPGSLAVLASSGAGFTWAAMAMEF
ncbi:MAG TPA: 3-oxoacyl-[acyl-carrier-protein] synthase III C-terminal domain-containing protein [Methanotrichaceae archaeon]|nr:3-oxoacyl-[acyl-carrier-protein] synthase III C-terminal domain-containing protein [Methanotrichaceae archaeon]